MFIQTCKNYYVMNRGDTFVLPLVINEGTKLNFVQYQLRQFDKIYIGIMEPNQSFENAIIRKVLTITSPTDSKGHPLFSLTPEDTENLLTGKYFIEIKIVQKVNEQDVVTTLMPLKEFFIEGTNKEVEEVQVYTSPKYINKADNETSWIPLEGSQTSDNDEFSWIPI